MIANLMYPTVFEIYLGISGFYAIFALDGYYSGMAGLDFSSEVAPLGRHQEGRDDDLFFIIEVSTDNLFQLILPQKMLEPVHHKESCLCGWYLAC